MLRYPCMLFGEHWVFVPVENASVANIFLWEISLAWGQIVKWIQIQMQLLLGREFLYVLCVALLWSVVKQAQRIWKINVSKLSDLLSDSSQQPEDCAMDNTLLIAVVGIWFNSCILVSSKPLKSSRRAHIWFNTMIKYVVTNQERGGREAYMNTSIILTVI